MAPLARPGVGKSAPWFVTRAVWRSAGFGESRMAHSIEWVSMGYVWNDFRTLDCDLRFVSARSVPGCPGVVGAAAGCGVLEVLLGSSTTRWAGTATGLAFSAAPVSFGEATGTGGGAAISPRCCVVSVASVSCSGSELASFVMQEAEGSSSAVSCVIGNASSFLMSRSGCCARLLWRRPRKTSANGCAR